MKILRQKIVALKKNKMNAGNLGFSKEWEYKNFVLQVGDLFWFKTFLDIMNNLSSNYLSLVAYSGNSRIMTHVYLIFVFHPEPFHLSRNPMCIIQLFILVRLHRIKILKNSVLNHLCSRLLQRISLNF